MVWYKAIQMLPSSDDVDSLKIVIFRETICEIQISINEKCVGDHFLARNHQKRLTEVIHFVTDRVSLG